MEVGGHGIGGEGGCGFFVCLVLFWFYIKHESHFTINKFSSLMILEFIDSRYIIFIVI